MIKTIMPGDYDWSDQQAVLFDVGSRGLDRDQMQKRAAAGIFNNVDIQPKPGRSIIHLIALGDAERYGPNRNSDFFYGTPREIQFPEPRGSLKSIKLATGNVERAWTFEKYARVYRDHCFPPGTPVLMADGTYKAIESVVIGDSVISGAGVPRRVVRTYIHDSPKNLISFDVAGSRQPILCTDEHPFGVVRGDHTLCRKLGYAAANRCYPHTAGTRGVCQSRGCSGNGCDMSPEWMEARNVRHGDYFLVPRETSTPADSFFDGADAAYFLGLFLAEGGFSHGLLRKDSLATLTFCGDERHLADAAVAFLSRKGWRFRGPYGPYAKSNTLTIEIVGASAVSELRRLSGGLAYSHEKTVPPGLYGCSSEMRLAFLGGYMDGDGSWSDVKHVLRGRTVSFDGLQGLWRLAASVGIPAYMCCDGQSYVMRNKAVQKDYVCRPSGVLAIYGAWTRALQPYCFKLAHVDFDAIRRSGNSLVLPSFVGFPITRIAEVPATAATVHNLEVEVDNSYIVNGFAVHNCNKKTDKSYGDVLKAAHNGPMARTELLIDVPNDDPVWRDDIEKVANGEDIFFSMSCFPAGTPVRMADGTERAIEQVGIGEKVLTHHGRVGCVSALLKKDYSGLAVEIGTIGLSGTIVATPDHKIWVRPDAAHVHDCPVCGRRFKSLGAHLWQVRDPKHAAARRDIRKASEGWVAADAVLPGDFVRSAVDRGVVGGGSEALAIIAGYYLAEGSLCVAMSRHPNGRAYTNYRTEFCFHEDETAYIDELKTAIAAAGYGAASVFHYPKEHRRLVRSHSRDLYAWVSSACGSLSGKKKLSQELRHWDPTLQKVVLEKWLEGDGGWSRVHENVTGTTVSRQLALDMLDIAGRCDIVANLYANTKRSGRQRVYNLIIPSVGCAGLRLLKIPSGWQHTTTSSVRDMGKLRSWQAGCTCVQTHARINVFVENGFTYRKVSRVRRVPLDQPVYDLTVPGDHGFIAGGIGVSNCKVPGDHCSICGNFSKSRKAKDGGTDCRHIKHQLSCLSKSGHRVGMINDHMVFFDISRVRVPADRIAYSLLKVAGLGGGADLDDERALHVFNVPRISGEDDPLGLYASKLSEVLHKLSNIEKQIEAVGRAPNESLSFDPAVMRHLSDDERTAMGQNRGDIGKVLAALADKKICLSLSDFVKLVLGERAGGYENSIRLASDSLPGVFSRLAEESEERELPESAMDEGEASVPRRVSEMIEAMKGGMSLDDEPVARRVTIVAIRKLPPPDLKKAASLYDETADKMLRAYAAYKVAWCLRNGIDSRVTKLAVLQHYVGSN